MPVSPSPKTAPPIKSETVAISTSYPNVSTILSPPNTAGGGSPSPQQPAAYLGRCPLAPRVNPPSTDTPSRASRSGVVSTGVEVSSCGRTVRMMVRPLRVRTGGYSRVGLTIPIKAVFLPTFCPALLQGFDFRGSNNGKTTKREYESPNRHAWLSLLRPLFAHWAPHRRRPDAPGKSDFV